MSRKFTNENIRSPTYNILGVAEFSENAGDDFAKWEEEEGERGRGSLKMAPMVMADNTVAEEPSTGVKEVDGNKEMGIANDFVEGRLPADKDGDGNTEETSDNVKDGNGLNGDQNLNVGDDKTPQLGMVFKSYGEACYFYKQYAQSVGFAATVRRSSFKENGECLHLILACCKWGKGREGEEYQSRPTAKTNCQASIKLRHALAVLKFQQVYEIPSHYILSRWQKDYKRLHLLEQSCDDVASKNLMEKYDYLSMRCLQLLEVGLISNDKYQLALKLIREVEKQLLDDSLQGDGNQKNREDLATLQFGFSQNEQVHDSSQQVKRRGRPPKKRKEAEAEAITRSNTGMGSSMTALVGDHRDVLQVGPTSAYLGSHSHIQGGTNLMADVNLNDYSSSSHFGMHVNPQHPVAGLSGIHVNPQHPVAGQSGIQPSIIESQYSPQTIGNHGRSQWLYHQIFQEQQLPRAPHGANR
ncbi:uncharacterized protein A4U43_C09F5100 [Asparagus officinalis]|uniref:Protein FAR1-RELATED SEQUENCE n=1 Tax=Asparagus officinalis TaxID=4686 RepID=A0A5P1E8Q3_ASPOF|nr:uncharacterized protein A4U43_C09F5100 [Asparagus officinalis]